MNLQQIALSTLAIVDAGRYQAPSGQWRELGPAVAHAVAQTRLYTPAELAELVAAPPGSPRRPRLPSDGRSEPILEVTGETTGAAARRLAASGPVVALNFASAVEPGGGVLRGAQAQEEDLARCSALYACLLPQQQYYQANLASPTRIYTDHLLYSPAVPFFRDDAYQLLEQPYPVSVITAPAPNTGIELQRRPDAGPAISRALARRAAMVLAVARAQGHRRLVLGAWGCGAFGNDPREVATIFAELLTSASFADAFAEIVFAIYDRGPAQPNRSVFRDVLRAAR